MALPEKLHRVARWLVASLLLSGAASATIIPRISFGELVDVSDLIVSGQVTRTWAEWDNDHKYIWTHYELQVASAPKGRPAGTVEFAEPGGVVGGVGMMIAGSVIYTPGENVLVFLQRMPNGYLRTTGWGQGKYGLDSAARLRADVSLRGVEPAALKTAEASPSLQNLSGMNLGEVTRLIVARVQAQAPGRAR
jgi:hypothetical protein